ncbi:MAG TPA: NADP-dependent oxidoreductase [Dongiaceae bacterium]|nr:NADP-dependent oxidoreductase [Dongiaceae bacterium]
MRAVILEKFGGAEHLADATLPMPAVGGDDVLIRVKAVGFNPTDYQLRQNGHPSLKPPVVLGRDVAGVVEACGANVRDLNPGDAVFANLVPRWLGGYAEYVAAPACYVALKPVSLSFAEAASVPVAAMTALCALRRARPDASKSLLVASGAGGVGSWAIGFAKAFSITRIVTTAGSDASRGYIKDVLGIDAARIVDYRGRGRADLAQATIAANGGLFEIALDCVGGAMTHLCCDVVAFEGDVVSVVNGPKDQSRAPAEADEDQLFDRSAAFHFEMISAIAYGAPAERQGIYRERLRDIAGHIERGAVRLPAVTTLGPLSAATVREAHRRLESGHTIGKLVATVD